eukprot:7054476-Prymnesium_polylepis.2
MNFLTAFHSSGSAAGYCKSELWKAGSLMPDATPDGKAGEVRAMTEHVMAMAFTASSHIAQRLANALVQLFSIVFEEADAARASPSSQSTTLASSSG